MKKTKAAKKVVELNLRNDYVEAKPITYEFEGTKFDFEETGNGWRSWDAVTCEKCGKVIVVHGEANDAHSDVDQDSKCDGYVSASAPMMSYFYPVEWYDTDAAAKLAGLPLCLVEVDGTKGIALTGGGMDLSWEICEAYIRLGYLPPVHYAGKLPMMAGQDPESTREVIQAAKRSAEIAVRWAQNAVEEIERVEAWIAERAKKAVR